MPLEKYTLRVRYRIKKMSKNNNAWKTPVLVVMLVIASVAMIRHYHIKNFKTVVAGVLYTSGQPRGMDYTRLLYKYHIGTFVNVRLSSEHREDNWYNEERTWMSNNGNGVNYVEIPIEKHSSKKPFPDKHTQKKFLDIMADQTNWPVLLHGNNGTKRPSMLTALWLIKQRDYSVDEATKAAKRIMERSLTGPEKTFITNLAGS